MYAKEGLSVRRTDVRGHGGKCPDTAKCRPMMTSRSLAVSLRATTASQLYSGTSHSARHVVHAPQRH